MNWFIGAVVYLIVITLIITFNSGAHIKEKELEL